MSATILRLQSAGSPPISNPKRRNQWWPKGVVDFRRYRVKRDRQAYQAELAQADAAAERARHLRIAKEHRERAARSLFELAMQTRRHHLTVAEVHEEMAMEALADAAARRP